MNIRRASYIHQLNYKDERLCSIIKNSQHISQKQAMSIVSKGRLDNYEKQSVLRKLHYIDNNKKEIVYELTPKGRDWISRNFRHLGSNFYTSTGIRHDLTLADEIIRRTNSHNQWLNERDLREILLREIERSDKQLEFLRQLESGYISVPDGGYISEDGSIECVEIINNNYTSTQLQAKDNYQNITNLHITYIKQH